MYILKTTQKLPISIEKAWDFFSNPNNLKEITPPEMDFVTRTGTDREMYPGQILTYTVKPMLGIPVTWITEITHVVKNEYFVDEQRFGPYVFWHHKHFFTPINGGVLMEDVVHYKLPFGFIGKWLHGFYVKKKLQSIFKFRKNKLISLFGVYLS